MKNLLKTTMIVTFLFLLSSCSQESFVWIPGWNETTALNEPKAGVGVVVADGYIYMIGGANNEGFLRTTEYAKIQKDGSLGPWKFGPLLTEERGHAEAVVHNGYIYIAGGANGPNGGNLLSSVERTRIQPDGSMAPWVKEKSSMGLPRRCSELVVKGNYIYALGGYGGTMLDTVVRTEILDNGSLGEWELEQEPMLVPHYVNGVKESRGVIYVVGGHAQKKGGGITDVERSRIMDNGELEEWKRTSRLKNARYGLSTAVYGDYLYALGGIEGVKFTEIAEKAKIDPKGDLAEWEPTTALSQPRATFSTVVFKDWIYVLGGAYNDSYLSSVEYATINRTGDIGFRGSKADEAAYKERLALFAEEAAKAKLPNKGIAKKIFQTDTYTYIKVAMKGGTAWIATPTIELDVNTKIRFSEGSLMSDFYSKSLKRTFPTLFLVNQVESIEIK